MTLVYTNAMLLHAGKHFVDAEVLCWLLLDALLPSVAPIFEKHNGLRRCLFLVSVMKKGFPSILVSTKLKFFVDI